MAAFNGKYIRKKEVWVKFKLAETPLENCGTALAYHFIRGGFTTIKGYLKENEVDEFEAIIASLYRDIVELKARIDLESKSKDEAQNFQVCSECATEIDLRLMGTYTFDPNTGMVKHVRCPDLKPKDQRDF